MKGYMYILACANGAFYTGSTVDLGKRLAEHQAGFGANFTRKYLPVELVYFEEYARVDQAFYREKQIQGWGRSKKIALINGDLDKLHNLSACQNKTHFKNYNSKKE
ncbi:GIY-YIG nuclease family protein [Echinicola strongylocentroti]|uniref:GIY-YIG nuclease family protein n=1 Tax=Echinicola strongylocentroti TaxID=1795355 RepID=A0A2Z4IJ29_9BACT|nr:GIY-YIG nuclease family protein [Echinicola strongylocentroti]AWW30749.1 GIY-YIG nuclease family protein [Echinicola strongylocentroti]